VKPLTYRRITQIGALLFIFMTPLIAIYKRQVIQTLIDYTEGLSKLGYNFLNLAEGFSGFYWAITFGGYTFLDPLAALQVILDYHPLNLSFFFAVSLPILLALLFGRVFCSWLCPVNTIREATNWLADIIGFKKDKPQLITNSNLRYVILLSGIAVTFLGFPIFNYILPYAVLGRALQYLSIAIVFWQGIMFFLLIILLDGIWQRGLWCNYLCPTSALLSAFAKKSLFRLKRDENTCLNSCNICQRNCQWNAEPKLEKIQNCTNCFVCVEKCPNMSLSIGRK